MLSLNIKLHSFIISKEIAHPTDTIRVSITTIPDQQKQAKTFEIKKIDKGEISFKINFVGITEKIIFVFRKKTILGNDPIIASTVLQKEDINIYNEFINFESKKVDIYEPIQAKNKKKDKENENKKVVGKMEIDFSLREEFSKENYLVGNEFYQKYNKMNSFLINEKENSKLVIYDFE